MRLEGIGIDASETMAKEGQNQPVSWYRLCDSHAEIATQVSGGMPVNEKLSVLESDNAGYPDIRSRPSRTGWNRSAVHLDKRAILPTARVVNRGSDQFLVPWHESCNVCSWPGSRQSNVDC